MQSTQQEFIRCAYPVVKETVPLSSRGYYTNNKYPEVPPLMSDGRAITAAWQHDAVTNAKLIEENNIKSNWAYRKYLTQNATCAAAYWSFKNPHHLVALLLLLGNRLLKRPCDADLNSVLSSGIV